jgi:hypothetical protein
MQRPLDTSIDSMMLDRSSASLYRRLAFAYNSCLFFDRLGSVAPFSRFAVLGHCPLPRIPAHIARIGFDLFECIRTTSYVPDIGNVEEALLNAIQFIPQPPRYLSYWYNASSHSMVGMHIGVDLIRHKGKYYVIENNIGPSIYRRRRQLYDSTFDPIVSGIVSTAGSLGFSRVVPIAYRWEPFYLDEFERAGQQHGISVISTSCPLKHSKDANGMTALPQPLPSNTMCVIHSGLTTPVIRYIDNKWYAYKWLESAIKNELPADSLLAVPPTYDKLTLPSEDPGPRWPNLVIKLADSARSCHVIAARFNDEDEARKALGLIGPIEIPRKLRLGFAKSLLLGRDRVIYQAFIPPELDKQGHAQMIRLHLFVSPLRTMFLSAHLRISGQPIPERIPHGLIQQDNAFIFNDASYRQISGEMEDELRIVADHLGQAMQRAIARKFEISNRKIEARSFSC